MYGVVKGLYNCQQGRVEDLNKRIYNRNLPNTQPQMCFSPRPVPTQYTTMPIMDQVAKASVPIKLTSSFNTRTNFLPGDSAPWSGFKNNVETESSLFNMYFALQACPQAYYIPSSQSELYNKAPAVGRKEPQTHPELFRKDQASLPLNTNLPCGIPPSNKIFYNNSRQNVLDIKMQN
jgi:hypothetical protein